MKAQILLISFLLLNVIGKQNQSGKEVLIVIGEGSESLETITPIELLLRAGAKVTIVTVDQNLDTKLMNGPTIIADKKISEVSDLLYDAILFPGGKGAEKVGQNSQAVDLLKSHYNSNKLVAAICAAPAMVLFKNNVKPAQATCYPGSTYISLLGDSYVDQRVVESDNTITSQGPGTSLEWAFAIVQKLYGNDKAEALAEGIIYNSELRQAKLDI